MKFFIHENSLRHWCGRMGKALDTPRTGSGFESNKLHDVDSRNGKKKILSCQEHSCPHLNVTGMCKGLVHVKSDRAQSPDAIGR